MELSKIVFFIIYVSHYCACAWHYLGIVEIEYWKSERSWLMEKELYEKGWGDRYVPSLYWSVITTLTIGYGDINPVTNEEMVFVIVVGMIICGVFGYSISQIGEIFKTFQEKKNYTKARLKMVDQHVRRRGITTQLQMKVKKYFEYYYKLEQEESRHGEDFIHHLTKSLKEEVLIDIYKKHLKKSRFLRDNFSEETINKFCLRIRERKYTPEEKIFHQGEQVDCLLFIMTGGIKVYVDHQSTTALSYL